MLKRPLVSVIDRTGEAEQMSFISVWTPSGWIKQVKHTVNNNTGSQVLRV